MNKKLISVLLAGVMLFAVAGCGTQNSEDLSDGFERTIEVNLDAYSENGGMLSVVEIDAEDGETAEYGSVGILAAEGETIGEALNGCGYLSIEPQCEGDEFEGWLEYTIVTSTDEDGIESTANEFVSEKLYSTEELLKIVVTGESNYIAKWAGISLEDYFKMDAWDGGTSTGSFSFSANGGTMGFYTKDGTEFENPVYTYWLDDGQALNDIMGTEAGDALINIENEGKEFAGWTVYEADSVFWNNEPVEEDDMTSFLYDQENEDTKYLLLRNATVIREASPTEEICAFTVIGKSYYAVANWK